MIERTAPRSVLFSPSNFYDNDELFLDDIRAGQYPMPMRGVNRVAVSDVGELCAQALLDPDFPSGTYSVSGPRSLVGSSRRRFGPRRSVGRSRTPAATSRRRARSARPSRATRQEERDFRASFRTLGRFAIPTSAADVAETTRLLGRPPRAYADYVRDLARTKDLISRPDQAE